MPRNAHSLAAGCILTALLAGCSLSSPDKLAEATSPTTDTHLTILQTTDMHHHAAGVGPVSYGVPGATGSYARVAAYVNYIRENAASNSPVVLVDSGDFTMGTLYDLTIGSQPMATFFLDTLRYDCAALGNHEFDYTPAGLASMLAVSQSKFGFHTPLVASNMVLNGNTDLAPYVGTSIHTTYTKTLSTGLKVGFIGLMGTEAASAAAASSPVTFTDYSADYTPIQTLVNTLRNTDGCHVVIALSHAGTSTTSGGYTGEDVDLASNVTGIDVIASGHTHNAFLDASAAHTVTNGTWTTKIICAGAFTANVARVDLTYHVSAKNTTVDSSSNKAMTAATFATLGVSPALDPAQSVFVSQADVSLNYGMGTLFTTMFGTDYSATDPTTGLYHAVGVAAQDMISNDQNAVLSPNGLGNLCADSVRNVPNGLIVKSMVAAGWDGVAGSASQVTAATTLATLGYDLTPFTVGVVPTGVIRDQLAKDSSISFANAYNVLSLGISPDTTQSIPIGYPLMSVYLSYADLQKLCALQLVSQTNLTPSDYYLNLSGISYALDATGAASYFKHATAAAVLNVVSAKAAAGSTAAATALADLAKLGTDSGAALLADMSTNAYAAAMVALNDSASTLTSGQIAANLGVLGVVAYDASLDAATGSVTLNTLIMNKAIAAIGQVSAFASTDPSCTGAATALSASGRFRVAGDLYAVMMMGAAQSKFGVAITAYAAATGTTTVSGSTSAQLAAAMAYRINATTYTVTTPSPAVQELKEWMALVAFMTTASASGGLGGNINANYLSTATFTDFGTAGAAVQVRNSTYPIASVGQLMATLQTLLAAS